MKAPIDNQVVDECPPTLPPAGLQNGNSQARRPPRSGLGDDSFRLAFGVRETAQMLGISEKSVRRLIARGLLKPSKALRHHLIDHREILRFLEETSS